MIEHNRPASVAKIKSRDHAPAPLPCSPWRAYMKHLAKWALICIAVLFAAAFAVGVSHA